MRKGIAGLSALTQDVLRQKPTGGAVFAFRGRRGDRLKLLYWDGQGFCLYYKVLERRRFAWPSAKDGSVRLTSAQLRSKPRLLGENGSSYISGDLAEWLLVKVV